MDGSSAGSSSRRALTAAISRRLQRNAGLLLGIGVFALMLTLNLMTPTWGDDWHRTMPGGDFVTVVKRIAWEYQTWTGRVSVLLLTYLFLWQYPGGLLLFGIVNAAVFCALIVGMFAIANGRMPDRNGRDAATLFLLFAAVWFFTEAFGEAVLWKTGAIGFLWVATATVFAAKPFVDLLSDQPVAADARTLKRLLPLGYFLLGMALENVSAAMIVLMLGTMAACRYARAPVPRWLVYCVLAYIAGAVVLVAAPGNFARYAMQASGEPVYARLVPLVQRIWHQETATTGLFPVILLALLTASVVVRSPLELRRFAIVLMLATLIALAMIGSTGIAYGGRTAFCAEVMFVAALGAIVSVIFDQKSDVRLWLPGICAVATIWGADALKTLEQYRATYEQTARRREIMDAYHRHGVRVALLPSYQVPYINGLHDDLVRGRYFLRDIHGDIPGNGWRNGTFAEDHGFEFAVRINKSHLLFQPELSENSAFKTVLRDNSRWLLSRERATLLGHVKAVYLIAPNGQCEISDGIKMALSATYKWDSGSTALVDQSGRLSTNYCVNRGIPVDP